MSQGDIARHVKALLEAGNAGEAAVAAKALGTLAHDNDANCAAIADAGAIAPLVALVTNGTADGQELAARTLATLAGDEFDERVSTRAAIVKAGGIPPLVALVANPATRCQEQAARALANLADVRDDANHIAIAEAGAIAPLVALVANASAGGQEQAARALANLASSGTAIMGIAAAGAIDPLVALVRNGAAGCQAPAARALGVIAFYRYTRVAVPEAGIAPLVALVTNGSTDGKKWAAYALQHLAYYDANSTAIVDAGGISPLVALLRSAAQGQADAGCVDAGKNAAWALGDIVSGNAAHQAAAVTAGAVDPLVALACRKAPPFDRLKAAAKHALDKLNLTTKQWVATIASRAQTLQAENESLKRRLFRMASEELYSTEQPPWRVKTPHPP